MRWCLKISLMWTKWKKMLSIWSVCQRWEVSYVACAEVLKVEYVVSMVIGPGISLFQRKPEQFFPNIYAHRWETALIWEVECPNCFLGAIHVCRVRDDRKFQSTCQPKHQGLGSEDHKAQLHLFPRACSEASTTLIPSITHWQSQKGAIISHENVTVRENIHPKLCRIKALDKKYNLHIAMPSFSFIIFLNIQCLMQCCEHSLDPFSVMST